MTTAIALLLGAVTWSLLEYCIHRWMGHDKRTMPNFFSTEHVRHHSEGDYFASNTKKITAATLFSVAIGVPAYLIAGPVGLAYMIGLVGFYVFYEVLHRLEHVDGGATRYGRWARRHHFHHHFHNPKMNHGVTSPAWDLVFGTYQRPAEVIEVPEKLKMQWLTDPATNDVWPRFDEHYALRRSKSRPAQAA